MRKCNKFVCCYSNYAASITYSYIEKDFLFNSKLHTSVFDSAQYTWLSAHQFRQLRGNVASNYILVQYV